MEPLLQHKFIKQIRSKSVSPLVKLNIDNSLMKLPILTFQYPTFTHSIQLHTKCETQLFNTLKQNSSQIYQYPILRKQPVTHDTNLSHFYNSFKLIHKYRNPVDVLTMYMF